MASSRSAGRATAATVRRSKKEPKQAEKDPVEDEQVFEVPHEMQQLLQTFTRE